MRERAPAIQYADLAQQDDTARLGMWTFLATEVLFFGGAILAYAVYRYGYPKPFADAARHTHIVIGTVNTALLLTSSFAVAWAVEAAGQGARRFAALLVWIAAAIGCVFLMLKGYEYRAEFLEGLWPGAGFAMTGASAAAARLFFIFYFVTTSLHGLHVAIGIVVLIAIGRQLHRRTEIDRFHTSLRVAALYWHFVDLVWIVLFALIYLPGRA